MPKNACLLVVTDNIIHGTSEGTDDIKQPRAVSGLEWSIIKSRTLQIPKYKIYENETQMINWMCACSIVKMKIYTYTPFFLSCVLLHELSLLHVNSCGLFTYIIRADNSTTLWDEQTSHPNYDLCLVFNCNLHFSIQSMCFRVTWSALRRSYSDSVACGSMRPIRWNAPHDSGKFA